MESGFLHTGCAFCEWRGFSIFDFQIFRFSDFRFSIFFVSCSVTHARLTAPHHSPQPATPESRRFKSFGIREFRLLHSHSHSHSPLPHPRSNHHPPNAEVYSNILNKPLPPQSEEYARPSTLPHAGYLPRLTLLHTGTTELSDFSDFRLSGFLIFTRRCILQFCRFVHVTILHF